MGNYDPHYHSNPRGSKPRRVARDAGTRGEGLLQPVGYLISTSAGALPQTLYFRSRNKNWSNAIQRKLQPDVFPSKQDFILHLKRRYLFRLMDINYKYNVHNNCYGHKITNLWTYNEEMSQMRGGWSSQVSVRNWHKCSSGLFLWQSQHRRSLGPLVSINLPKQQ